jgi:hypothetical protein
MNEFAAGYCFGFLVFLICSEFGASYDLGMGGSYLGYNC